MVTNSRLTGVAAAVALVLAVAVANAQPGAPQFLKIVPRVSAPATAGKPFTIDVAVSVDAPYHIQGNPSKEGYITTELEIAPTRGFKVDKVVYPKPTLATISGDRLPVYHGKIAILVTLTPDKTVTPGRYMLPLTLKYQGCDEQKCFPPSTRTVKAAVTVKAGARRT